jgi:polypyrimidine tract-binding protein 1
MAGLKRNLQEMLKQDNNIKYETHNCDSNDGSSSITAGVGANDAKKTRLDNLKDPSRVVHLRNIPQQLSETEIIHLGLSFGVIVNVLFLRSKNQAFLEFEQINHAQDMINYFNKTPVSFSGRKIFLQYSNHQSLQTDPNNSNNQIAQVALDNALQLREAAKIGGKNTVLRATILNLLYPVTLDVLHQIFSKFGHALKIITFNKNDKYQALIQMKDAIAAQQAKMALHGQNIYNGCCTLQIEFSKLTTLEVRYNNDKSRDYTNLLLPSGDQASQSSEQNLTLPNPNGSQSAANAYSSIQQGIVGAAPNLQGGPPNTSQFGSVPSGLNYAGQRGGGGGGGGNSQSISGGLNYAGQRGSVSSGLNYAGNGNISGQQQHQQQQQQQQQHSFNQMNSPFNSVGPASQMNIVGSQAISPVLLISNLNEEFSTPEALFTLFGVYGDVQRVKILFNKKDSALIQFSNGLQSATALQNLDRCKVWNKQIRVFPSKHLTVQMPKDGQPDSGLTKDFTNSPLHRFKKPGSKNFNNIFPPSQTLHLSNLPASIQETDLKDIFTQYGTVRAFKFFQKDRKMALIQMDTVEEAVHALIGTHNYQLAENMHLRCTFSKATI